MDVITVRNLSKSFGTVLAVKNLNLTIRKGEMFALVGPDGAGKSTTIRLLCGIVRPTSGNASVLGFDITRQRSQIIDRIGYLSQRFSLYGDLSVDENIEFIASIHNVQDFCRRRDELLGYMRLTEYRHRRAEHLFGGMKQKLALTCTLIHKPDILLLDEPTTGIDPVSRRDFWRILSDLLKQKITIVLTTPYLDEAERCSRVGLMNNGTLMMVETPAKVKELIEGRVVELVCHPLRQAYSLLRRMPNVKEVQVFGDRLNLIVANSEDVIPQVEASLTSAHVLVTSIRPRTPSLENVFISLMQREGMTTDRQPGTPAN